MQINQTFFKLKLLKDCLTDSIKIKQLLLDECITAGGTDSTILMRRFRMISQLAQWEADITNKIYNFQITSLSEFEDIQHELKQEISNVADRSA